MAASNLPTTRFGDTITLALRACGCEQLTSDEVWGHDYATIASLWLRATYQRRGLRTHTITLPLQACSCEQVSSDEVWGHDYVTIAGLWLGATYQRRGLGTRLRYHRDLVAESNLPTTRFGDTITLPSQACVAASNLPANSKKNLRVYKGFRVQDDSRLGFKTTRVWSCSYLEYFWLPGPVHAHSQALPRPSP